MNRWLPLKARSEVAKASMFANLGSGGALGSSGGRLGSRSGGVSSPPGAFGSKKPSGLGSVAIRFMFFAASPASRRPALSPTRGSLVVAVGAGRSCAPPSSATNSDTTPRPRHVAKTDLICKVLTLSLKSQVSRLKSQKEQKCEHVLKCNHENTKTR